MALSRPSPATFPFLPSPSDATNAEPAARAPCIVTRYVTTMSDSPRRCACGCGRDLPRDASAKRVWASDACRQRGHRGRQLERARARRASVEAAVERRDPRDLAALLEVAQQEALRRPGSVLLRVSGRLIALSAEELVVLAAGLERT